MSNNHLSTPALEGIFGKPSNNANTNEELHEELHDESNLREVLSFISQNASRIMNHVDNKTEGLIGKLRVEQKESEDRAVRRSCDEICQYIDKALRNWDGGSRRKSSKKEKSDPEEMPGVDLICTRDMSAWATSVWICEKSCDDLSKFWLRTAQTEINSALCVYLFGVQRMDGFTLYKTTLGKELREQAKDIVSRMMWYARRAGMSAYSNCDNPPLWLFSLVKSCRSTFITETASESTRNPRSESQDNVPVSPGSNPASASTSCSGVNADTDYKDLVGSNRNAAWQKEAKFFKEAIKIGCTMMEEKKEEHEEILGKVARGSAADASSQRSIDFNIRKAQEQIASGADSIRRRMSNFLSNNRWRGRRKFYDMIGFLVYHIQKQGVDAASADGFSIEFQDPDDAETALSSSQNNFNAAVGTTMLRNTENIEAVDEENNRRLEAVVQQFPSYTLKCKYKASVQKGTTNRGRAAQKRCSRSEGSTQQASSSNSTAAQQVPLNKDDGNRDGIEIPDLWICEDNVSLHSVSIIVLCEFTRIDGTSSFLGSSEKALHTVHIFATAFRGLIRRSLGLSLSSMEDFLLGQVYLHTDLVPREKSISSAVMLFKTDDANDGRLRKRLTITKKEYLTRKNIQKRRRLAPIVSVESDEDDSGLFVVPTGESDNLRMPVM